MAIATTKPGGAPGAATAGRPPAALAAPNADISPYRWIILIGLLTAAIMEVLDTTIINVALPQMAGNLGATNTEIGWVSTGYILSNVVVLPMTAWLAGRFGRKNYLTFSVVLFIAASFFCGTSHTLGEIVFWRIIQGVGGAALLSTAQATLREIFPQEQQSIVQALFTLGIVMAPTLGPTLGGFITDNYSWNWVFFINIPIGIVSLFLISGFLEDGNRPRSKTPADFLGIALLAVGLGSLQYVLEEGNKDDWFQSATITNLALLSGICLSVMLFWELSPRNRNPVVNFRVLKNKQLASALFLFFALGFGLYGGIFIFPLFVQNILRFTPTETGLVLLPGGIATGIGVVICGRLLSNPKVDPRYLITIGLCIFCFSMWELGHLTTQSGVGDTRFSLIIRGLGLGFLFTPINIAAFSGLSRQETPQASGLINLTRQMGGSLGIAILSTYITNQTVFHRSMLASHIYAGNPAVIERQQALTNLLISKGYTATQAQSGWLGIVNRTVTQQAQTQSYNDAFLLILVVFLFTAPAVFLLRRNPPPGGGGPAAAPEAH